jgi:hypothetical protein
MTTACAWCTCARRVVRRVHMHVQYPITADSRRRQPCVACSPCIGSLLDGGASAWRELAACCSVCICTSAQQNGARMCV